MAAWLGGAGEERVRHFALWRSAFLTPKGEIRARLCTKDVESRCPGTSAVLAAEADRLFRLTDRLRSRTIVKATAALLSWPRPCWPPTSGKRRRGPCLTMTI